MHACARQRSMPSPRPLRRLVRRLFRFAGIDPRRCFCGRCVAARSVLFRRTRPWAGRRAYADVYLPRHRVQPALRLRDTEDGGAASMSSRRCSVSCAGQCGKRRWNVTWCRIRVMGEVVVLVHVVCSP